jgi:ribosomal protein S18 acetylase RimI-like enzyme
MAVVGIEVPTDERHQFVLPSTNRGMSDDYQIRKYRGDDAAAIRECIVALQDYERQIDPRLRPGSFMAPEYLNQMHTRCRDFSGCIFVLDCAGVVAGFVTVLTRVPFQELDDPPGDFALITDLIVLERFRKRGFGRALMAAAERYACDQGASELRIGVLSANQGAKRLYMQVGFSGHLEILTKRFESS